MILNSNRSDRFKFPVAPAGSCAITAHINSCAMMVMTALASSGRSSSSPRPSSRSKSSSSGSDNEKNNNNNNSSSSSSSSSTNFSWRCGRRSRGGGECLSDACGDVLLFSCLMKTCCLKMFEHSIAD